MSSDALVPVDEAETVAVPPKIGTELTQGNVIVDALPYFDVGYDDPVVNVFKLEIPTVPGVRESANEMVEEETRRHRPTRNYLDYLPPPDYKAFETDIMRAEFERLQARLPMETLSMKRYELPPPPAGKLTDVSAWLEAVENSQAQLEHQALRIVNLQLLEEKGAGAWKSHNDTLVAMVEAARRQLTETRHKAQEINWERKKEQTAVGAQLKALEDNWVALVSQNYQLEMACQQLSDSLLAEPQQASTADN